MKDKRNHHGAVGKSSSEQHFHFVNPPPLSLLCEISGGLHLAQPGPAGWLAGWLAGSGEF